MAGKMAQARMIPWLAVLLWLAGAAVAQERTGPVGAAVLVVGGEGATHASIQAAIDAAPEGAVVRIRAGVYEGSLRIGKSLVLEGAGWEKTTIVGQGPDMEALRREMAELEERAALARTQEERAAIVTAFREKAARPAAPVVLVEETRGVELRGLKMTARPAPYVGGLSPWSVVVFCDAQGRMSECAVLGSPGNGVQIAGNSDVTVEKSLVAGVWNTGIVIGARGEAAKAKAVVVDCDIRNCHYAGVAGAGQEARIERCWISGAAWHGIRYDDASPLIRGNRISGNARCGIYASGRTAATISGNVLARNEMTGISCWFANRDSIVGNTFAENGRAGLESLGGSRPTVDQNVFYGHDAALGYGAIGGGDGTVGTMQLAGNVFWKNMHVLERRPLGAQPAWEDALPGDRSIEADPRFVDANAGDYALAVDSPVRQWRAGAAEPLAITSPWPLQPEEKAIIPDGPTRDSRAWKGVADGNGRWPVPVERPASPRQAPPAERTVSYEQAFTELYEVLGREYPCFDLKGIDWKKVGAEFLPRVKEVKTDEQFGLLCMELVARLEDSHAFVGRGSAEPPSPPQALWDPGLACLIDDRGRPVVYHVDEGGPAEKAGVRPGMAVLKINGEPAGQAMARRMKELQRCSGYSSDRYLRYHAAQYLARQMERNAQVRLELEDAEGTMTGVEVPAALGVRYVPRLPVAIAGIGDSAEVSWRMLEGRIGYIYVRRIGSNLLPKLDQAVGELKDARGLIIDVRGNSGGGFDAERAHRNFAPADPQEPDRPRFAGPIAVLIDARCISAGEGWASWFVTHRRAKFFGEATAGASSRKRSYMLANGLYTVTFPVKAYTGYLDRPIERRGLEPDVAIRQNARDLSAGRDTVLERARRFLEEHE